MPKARVVAFVCLLLLSGACGKASETADSAGSTTASGPRDQPDPDSRAGAAVDALVAEDMPTDEESLLRVLDAMPDELLGRERRGGSEGEIFYGPKDEQDLFLVAMEAEDVGTGETKPELLERVGREAGRVVVDRQTDPSMGLMYVAGTEGSGDVTVHFLAWTTADGPYIFAAGAHTPEALDALVNEFAEASVSG